MILIPASLHRTSLVLTQWWLRCFGFLISWSPLVLQRYSFWSLRTFHLYASLQLVQSQLRMHMRFGHIVSHHCARCRRRRFAPLTFYTSFVETSALRAYWLTSLTWLWTSLHTFAFRQPVMSVLRRSGRFGDILRRCSGICVVLSCFGHYVMHWDN